jgi:hypothetical protein
LSVLSVLTVFSRQTLPPEKNLDVPPDLRDEFEELFGVTTTRTAVWLRRHPYTARIRGTKLDHEQAKKPRRALS